MTETAIVAAGGFVAPVTDVHNALMAYQAMKEFVQSVLRAGVDYGEIPGTDKPTLLKPGAEKLSRFFGMSIAITELASEQDWTGERHGGEPFFFYRYKAITSRAGLPVAEGIGSCSSWEKKYRYRSAKRKCPACGAEAIIKGREEYGGGWICYKKQGGCGAKFGDSDQKIVGQEVGQVVNPDPADLVNTVDKMAQKRAIVAAVLLACNASEYFTQDAEDYITEGEFREVESAAQPAPTPAKQPVHAPARQTEQGKPPVRVVEPSTSGNGKGQRPLSPEALREAINKKAEKCSDKIAEGARGLMVGQLNDLYDGDENKRHQLTRYLFGTGTTKGMPGNYCNALLDWMKDLEMARREAAAVIVMLDAQNQPSLVG